MQRVRHTWQFFSFFFTRFNPFLAFCLLIDEIRGEWQYKLHTTGFEAPPPFAGAYSYLPSNYVLLHRLFNRINEYSHNGTLLDLGCGKGRALAVAAHYGFRDLYGVDLVEDYCRSTEMQLSKNVLAFPNLKFKIYTGDAGTVLIPGHIQTVFLYNSFDETVLKKVMEQIAHSIKSNPRTFYILYVNPLYRELILDAGFEEVYSTSRYAYLKAAMYRYLPTGLPS
jgi:SAM-dependent methyltransferase